MHTDNSIIPSDLNISNCGRLFSIGLSSGFILGLIIGLSLGCKLKADRNNSCCPLKITNRSREYELAARTQHPVTMAAENENGPEIPVTLENDDTESGNDYGNDCQPVTTATF